MIAHPYADRFPMLGAEELDRLAADIAENGLRHPVVLDQEGRILDGRNRWAACEQAGITPETVVYEGGDLAAFVLSNNVARRHLTTGQQAMSTALVLVDAGKRENGKWAYGTSTERPESGTSAKSWKNMMAQSGVILDIAPELADSVVAGELALDAAFKQAERKREEERQQLAEVERLQAEEDDARKRLRSLAPDYMAALDSGEYRSARQAFAAWEDDNRAAAARERQEQAKAEAKRKADLQNAESAAQALGRMLVALEGLTYPEHRQHLRSWWADGAHATTPDGRAFHNPTRIREFAQALLAYADEMEQDDE